MHSQYDTSSCNNVLLYISQPFWQQLCYSTRGLDLVSPTRTIKESTANFSRLRLILEQAKKFTISHVQPRWGFTKTTKQISGRWCSLSKDRDLKRDLPFPRIELTDTESVPDLITVLSCWELLMLSYEEDSGCPTIITMSINSALPGY